MFPLLKTTVSQGLPRSQGNFASTDRRLDNLHLGLCQIFDSDQTHVESGPAVVDRQGLHIVHDGLRCRSVRRFGCSRYFFANMTEKSTLPNMTSFERVNLKLREYLYTCKLFSPSVPNHMLLCPVVASSSQPVAIEPNDSFGRRGHCSGKAHLCSHRGQRPFGCHFDFADKSAADTSRQAKTSDLRALTPGITTASAQALAKHASPPHSRLQSTGRGNCPCQSTDAHSCVLRYRRGVFAR